MNEKELRKIKLERKTMKGIWLPPEYHKIISERAKEEGLPIYKYLIMLSNLYGIKN